jgi:hypothetical protein
LPVRHEVREGLFELGCLLAGDFVHVQFDELPQQGIGPHTEGFQIGHRLDGDLDAVFARLELHVNGVGNPHGGGWMLDEFLPTRAAFTARERKRGFVD